MNYGCNGKIIGRAVLAPRGLGNRFSEKEKALKSGLASWKVDLKRGGWVHDIMFFTRIEFYNEELYNETSEKVHLPHRYYGTPENLSYLQHCKLKVIIPIGKSTKYPLYAC